MSLVKTSEIKVRLHSTKKKNYTNIEGFFSSKLPALLSPIKNIMTSHHLFVCVKNGVATDLKTKIITRVTRRLVAIRYIQIV